MQTLESQTVGRKAGRGNILTVSRVGRKVLVAGLVCVALGLFSIAIVSALSEHRWDQCADFNPVLGTCDWINGNIAQGKTAYIEGSALPVRWLAKDIQDTVITNGLYVDVYTWRFDWGTTTNHGFDWLVSWEQAARLHQDYIGTALDLDRCGDFNQNDPYKDVCNLVTSPTLGRLITIPAPTDNYFSGICGPFLATCETSTRLSAFEAIYGPRYIDFYIPATTATINTSLQLWHTEGSGSDYLTASYVGYTLTITSTAQITSSMINFASHLALSGDPYSNAMAWGEYPVEGGGVGAAPITGANWHHRARTLNGAGSSTDLQVTLSSASSAAPIYSSRSVGAIAVSGTQVTDTITMTHATGPEIFGTVKFYVCGPEAIPNLSNPRDTTYHGCVTGGTLLDTAPGPNVPLNVITASHMSTATSPVFTPVQTGYYCFRAAYTPSGSPPLAYAPISDTNPFSLTTSVTYPNPKNRNQNLTVDITPECFQVYKTTAVRLSNFTATAGDGLTFAGFPVIGLIIGLMGIVASAGVGLVAWRTLKN